MREGDCKVNATSRLPGGNKYWGVFDNTACDAEDTPPFITVGEIFACRVTQGGRFGVK